MTRPPKGYREWQRKEPAPWIAYNDLPAIASRTAQQMKQGGAPKEDIFLVYSLLTAQAVMGPIHHEHWQIAAVRRRQVAALKSVNSTRRLPQAKKDDIRRLADELALRFKSKRSLHAAIARRATVKPSQVRQVLDPPQRKQR